MRKINIEEVAKSAGVSTTTVSRVMNQVATVSEENRRRVLDTMKRLKYHPNPSAQRLASGKTRTIGLIIPRFEGIFHSFYALQVIKGIGSAAERLKCDLLLHISESGARNGTPVAADGIVFVDIFGCEELLDRTLDQGIPTVVLNHYLQELPVSCVAIDNRTAAERVVEYLAKLGHQEIATITGDLKTQAGLDRLDGFVKAMKARNLAVKDSYIRFGDFGLPSARAASEALLSMPDRPTAIFVASDDMAMETLNVAASKGIRVPEELSVVGFDDGPVALHGRVPLTTVRQPLAEMGKIGLETLLRQMDGKRQTPVKLLLPTELIERASCRQTWLER